MNIKEEDIILAETECVLSSNKNSNISYFIAEISCYTYVFARYLKLKSVK